VGRNVLKGEGLGGRDQRTRVRKDRGLLFLGGNAKARPKKSERHRGGEAQPLLSPHTLFVGNQTGSPIGG